MTTPLRHLALVAHGIEPVALRRASYGRLEPVPPTTYPKGRECIYDSCPTVLSIYNGGPACWCHSARYEREIDQAIAA